MSDEIILTPSSITSGSNAEVFNQKIELPDDDPVVKALGLDSKPAEQPKTEPVAETKTEPAATTDATPQPTAPTDGTVKPEVKTDKVPYTEDELRALLADPNSVLDTSRLDERGQAVHKEFQRGYTKKFEELKRERDFIEKRKAEIAAFEERQRQIEAERKFREDVEQLGEDEAKRLQKERDMESRINRLESERRAFQQREAAEMFRREFNNVAPTHGVPLTQEMEDLTMSYLWANNQIREMNGQPTLTMEDGVRMISDQLGISNIANLEKIINANPKNKEAYEQKVINDYLKKKSAGPTVVSSSPAQVSEKPSDTESQPFDAVAYNRDPEKYIASRVSKIFEEKNLKVK